MTGKTRLISAPPAQVIHHERGTIRPAAGSSMASGVPIRDEAVALGPDRTEAPQLADDAWEAELRRRELAEGLPVATAAPLPTPQQQSTAFIPAAFVTQLPHPTSRPEADEFDAPDLTGLPEKFALEVERKGDWWKVTAPDVHIGLFVAHQDLLIALADAPGALAQIVRLDGMNPRERK